MSRAADLKEDLVLAFELNFFVVESARQIHRAIDVQHLFAISFERDCDFEDLAVCDLAGAGVGMVAGAVAACATESCAGRGVSACFFSRGASDAEAASRLASSSVFFTSFRTFVSLIMFYSRELGISIPIANRRFELICR